MEKQSLTNVNKMIPFHRLKKIAVQLNTFPILFVLFFISALHVTGNPIIVNYTSGNLQKESELFDLLSLYLGNAVVRCDPESLRAANENQLLFFNYNDLNKGHMQKLNSISGKSVVMIYNFSHEVGNKKNIVKELGVSHTKQKKQKDIRFASNSFVSVMKGMPIPAGHSFETPFIPDSKTTTLIGNDTISYFAEVKKNVYLLSSLKNIKQSDYSRINLVIEMLPFILLARQHVPGEIWHRDKYFANLTIDDPFLVNPYGCLDYNLLLKSMQQNRFHTTIAYIPWNCGRDAPDMIKMLKNNNEFFSLCVHGNDHDQYEFSDTSKGYYSEYAYKIYQSLQRIIRWESQTGVSVNRVFVYPQGIGPSFSFLPLKECGYLYTANSIPVPIDVDYYASNLERLRNAYMNTHAFASLQRFSLKDTIMPSDSFFIASHLFLTGNILLYTHHDFFCDENDYYSPVVGFINNIVSDIQWVDLEGIGHNLYWKKQKETQAHVLMESPRVVLRNNWGENIRNIRVKKWEPALKRIAGIAVNDSSVENYTYNDDTVSFYVSPNFDTAIIRINYQFDSTVYNRIDDYKSFNIYRRLSCFRDRYLYPNKYLRFFVSSYYDKKNVLYRFSAILILVPFLIIGVILSYKKITSNDT